MFSVWCAPVHTDLGSILEARRAHTPAVEVAEILYVAEDDGLLTGHSSGHMGAAVQVLHVVALQELQVVHEGLLRAQQLLDDRAGGQTMRGQESAANGHLLSYGAWGQGDGREEHPKRPPHCTKPPGKNPNSAITLTQWPLTSAAPYTHPQTQPPQGTQVPRWNPTQVIAGEEQRCSSVVWVMAWPFKGQAPILTVGAIMTGCHPPVIQVP